MKQTLKKLLCGVLLLAMPMAMFAKKSENDTIYRPLYTAFELNVGGAAWVEKPLSYFTFNGANLSLSLEMMRACRGESKWVQQHQLRYISYYWRTPRDGAQRLAACESLTTEIEFRFLVFEKR